MYVVGCLWPWVEEREVASKEEEQQVLLLLLLLRLCLPPLLLQPDLRLALLLQRGGVDV